MKELEKDMNLLRVGMKEVERELEFYRGQQVLSGDRYIFSLYQRFTVTSTLPTHLPINLPMSSCIISYLRTYVPSNLPIYLPKRLPTNQNIFSSLHISNYLSEKCIITNLENVLL